MQTNTNTHRHVDSYKEGDGKREGRRDSSIERKVRMRLGNIRRD